MKLTKIAETSSTITLGWQPVPGATGYRFSREGDPDRSHTWDPNRNSVKFAKGSDWYKVEALGVQDSGEYPQSGPEPGEWEGPTTITKGGTYSGSWESTGSTPAVRISTTEPVTIERSRVRNLTGARLMVSDWPLAVKLTVRHVEAWGGGTIGNPVTGRFLELEGHKSFVMENCTLNRTSGVRLNSDAADSSTLIRYNRHINIQHDTEAFGNFIQFNHINKGSIEVAWNEILNEYDNSWPEDILSLINVAGAKVHDNYLQHNSTPGNAYNTSSQGTITLEQGTRDCEIYSNQMVDTLNGVAFVAPASGNYSHHNRLIQDGKLPNGTQMGNGYSGYSMASGSGRMEQNVSGYVNRDGARLDWWPMADSEIAKNTTLPNTITRQMELDEWPRWEKKLADNGIIIGA